VVSLVACFLVLFLVVFFDVELVYHVMAWLYVRAGISWVTD